MPYNDSLANRVQPLISRRKGFTEKKMFGGVGYMLNGNMCCGVWREYLILRLGPDAAADALVEAHVKEFDITGKAMKGWIMIGMAGVENNAVLKEWVNRAIDFVKSLPSK